MPPEKSAYALARYSRSPDSIRDSIDWVRTHDSQKFLESFYFQYGHASIADLGHAVVCFEGISELAATEIEEEPLWDGQAKSSRYQDFSRSGFVTPPELADADAAALPARGRSAAGGLYSGAATGVRLPGGAPAAARRYEARCLPAQHRRAGLRCGALPAVLGRAHQCRPGDQHSHARKADPPPEGIGIRRSALAGRGDRASLRGANRIAAGIPNAAAEPLAPTLARHADPDTHAARIARAICACGRNRICRRSPGTAPERVDLVRPTNVPADIVATLLYPVTDRPFRELYEMAEAWSGRRRAEVIDLALALAHAPRRNPGRFPRRPLRLRFGDRYRRVSRSAPSSPLPEIPAGVFRRAWDSRLPSW